MATINDVRKLIGGVLEAAEVTGETKEFKQEFRDRCRAIGDAMQEDFGKSDKEEVAAMPPDTSLGPKAESLFSDLKGWLVGVDADFAHLV